MKNKQNKLITKAMLCLALAIALIAVLVIAPFLRPDSGIPQRLHMQHETAFEGVGIETIQSWEYAYMAVYYPVTQNEQVNLAVERWVEQSIAAFEANMQPHRRAEKDELAISFRVFRYDDDIISFLFRTYIHHIGNQDQVKLHAMTFDLSTGDHLGIAALFESEQSLDALSELAFEQLSHTAPYTTAAELDILREGTAPLPENFENFILDGDYLRFYFPRGQIGSSANPTEYFQLHLTYVQRHLRERFSERLPPLPEPPPWQPGDPPPPLCIEGLEDARIIALTFDDGPNPYITTAILDFLAEQEVPVPATFYVLGFLVEQQPHIVARAVREGHQIGNHTQNHRNLTRLSQTDRLREINRGAAAIEGALGFPPSTMRPPFGAHNAAVRADLDNPLVLWSIDPWDWDTTDVDYIVEHVVSRAQDGDIILLHDLYQSTYQATRRIVPALLEQGFTFGTIDQMLALRGEAAPGEVVFHRRPY